ncbi:MAG: hypothetical protein RSB78_06800, partial [Oscillospiraceae bacterium]
MVRKSAANTATGIIMPSDISDEIPILNDAAINAAAVTTDITSEPNNFSALKAFLTATEAS